MRIGSLFSGAGGLDMAVEHVFGGEVVWQSEVDPAASKVLAHRFPCAPNLGDITKANWNAADRVDIICGGFPCQDVSLAGKRAGIHGGSRSGLWAEMARIIGIHSPRYVVIENVRGLLSATAHRDMESADPVVGDGADRPVLRAIGAVLGDLSDLGYDAQWTTVSASSVGAPHRRERVFIVASLSGGAAAGQFAGGTPAEKTGKNTSDRSGDHRGTRADVELLPTPSACNANDGEGTETWLARREVVKARLKNGNGMGMPLAIAVQLLPTPTTQDGSNTAGPSQFERNTLPLNAEVTLLPTPNASDGSGGGQHPSLRAGHSQQLIDFVLAREQWGKYAPAIRRWEQIAGPAPSPTELNRNGKPRLNPAFSEWMMGWPFGWVTDPDIGISRNEQLKIVGNGVCPQQATAALRYLLSVSEVVA